MPERVTKRPAGATRIPSIENDIEQRADDVLTDVDLSGFTRPQLERVALDRGLSVNGTDAALRTRILSDLEV